MVGGRFRRVFVFSLLWMAAGAVLGAPAGYYLVWQDEFDGDTLDFSKWDYRQLGPRRAAVQVTNSVSVAGGLLTITTYTEGGTNFTGMIGTEGRFMAKYGYWESRMEFHDTPGEWSAFWLQSPTIWYILGDTTLGGVEVDIQEHRANSGLTNKIQHALHWDGYDAAHKSVTHLSGDLGLGTGFHTYAVDWTRTNFQFYVDGAKQWTTTPVSQRTQYTILSMEVENGWPGTIPLGGYGNLATSTTKLHVDYVRWFAPPTMGLWHGGSSSLWTDTGNWIATLMPPPNADIVFDAFATNQLATFLGADHSANGITVGSPSGPITIAGNTLTNGADGIDLLAATQDLTIESALVLSAAQRWYVAPYRRLHIAGSLTGGVLRVQGPGEVRLGGATTLRSLLVSNDATVRVFGEFTVTGSLTNNGVLDLINARATLPAGFVNNGTLLDASSVTRPQVVADGNDLVLAIESVPGHTYKLESTDGLTPAAWTNTTAAQTGTGNTLRFSDPGGLAQPRRFYRISIGP